ncbi:60S ribosomal protein L23 [Gonapodya prolifera JEL478]|uniref:60S ribosomal protein L23 n=1 Tax=Gonapodya prolifera (strain JEL478) TaxID=1344416 RepID=A0A139AB61_GONPJ|nr:60S ribosomal protein L23 [Gonapodya prolifera JEL478]|eukprot:KXS13899.1 60S ribosomal protein L23 [Gonapodya prolifera JEL478]
MSTPTFRVWLKVDASGKILGRLATSVAVSLMGKNKPGYVPAVDSGDFVVVTNAKSVALSGDRAAKKTYWKYTGYPGGRYETKFSEMVEKKPEEVIRLAVKRMLPKNNLRDVRLNRLKVFPGEAPPTVEANILKVYERS